MELLVESCPPAQALYRQGLAADFGNCNNIANQFHFYGKFEEAARFYRRAFDQYPVGTGYHPLQKNLLSTQMLCELKGGFTISRDDLDMLLALDKSYYCFISGCAELFKTNPDHTLALRLMGNCFEAFVCGHEAHCHFIKAALAHFHSPRTGVPMPNPWGLGWKRSIVQRIPNRLFFYWDKNPPPEIRDNFDLHDAMKDISVDVYSQQRAEAFLYDYYGSDTKATFVKLQHPAEQADFFRPHLVYAYGGYYLDADLRIGSLDDGFLKLTASSHQAMFSITETCLVDNGFFGATKNCHLMASFIDIVHANCHLCPKLSIDMKTGPGALTRMLAREYFRVMAFGDPITEMKIIDRDEWKSIIEVYPVTYKGDIRNWQIFQAHEAGR
jgi:hypothetical protein